MRLTINTFDLAILMYNVYRSAQEFEYNDAELGLDELIYQHNPPVHIKHNIIEKFLYCANMLDEEGKFWHPNNKSFNQFLSGRSWPEFDKKRNYFIGVKDGN